MLLTGESSADGSARSVSTCATPAVRATGTNVVAAIDAALATAATAASDPAHSHSVRARRTTGRRAGLAGLHVIVVDDERRGVRSRGRGYRRPLDGLDPSQTLEVLQFLQPLHGGGIAIQVGIRPVRPSAEGLQLAPQLDIHALHRATARTRRGRRLHSRE